MNFITCGSAIKLKLVEGNASPYLLHSAAFNWGTGSGQQVVSLIRKTEASEKTTLWQIQESHNAINCINGQPIRCGDMVRFMHLSTKKFLHTHNVASILSSDGKEVSAFGDGKTDGDNGDNWTVVCDGEFWIKGEDIKLKHVLTGSYLTRSVL